MSSDLHVDVDIFLNLFIKEYTLRFLPHLEIFSSSSPTHSFEISVKTHLLSLKKITDNDYATLANLFAKQFFEKYVKQLQTFDTKKVSLEEFQKEYIAITHTSTQTVSTFSKKPLNTKDHWVQADLPENKIILIKSFYAVVYIEDVHMQLVGNELVAKARIKLDKKLYDQTTAVNVFEVER
ncbi:MAG: hypothetical protein ACOCQQ_02010 [Candidatus Nanoarchaeia archaeon]